MMRKSNSNHPVALLRRDIGLNQRDFAKLAGISESTVAKVETGRLALSPAMALCIESQTGCDALWLLGSSGKLTFKPRSLNLEVLLQQIRETIEHTAEPRVAQCEVFKFTRAFTLKYSERID